MVWNLSLHKNIYVHIIMLFYVALIKHIYTTPDIRM